MIQITEHEAILNSELSKASEETAQKLQEIQSTVSEHMQKTLQEKLT